MSPVRRVATGLYLRGHGCPKPPRPYRYAPQEDHFEVIYSPCYAQDTVQMRSKQDLEYRMTFEGAAVYLQSGTSFSNTPASFTAVCDADALIYTGSGQVKLGQTAGYHGQTNSYLPCSLPREEPPSTCTDYLEQENVKMPMQICTSMPCHYFARKLPLQKLDIISGIRLHHLKQWPGRY